MGKTTRALTSKSSIDHLAVDSSTHKKDVEKGKAEKEALRASGGEVFYRLPTTSRIVRLFPEAPAGINVVKGLGTVTPPDWRKAIQAEEVKRRHYRARMWDKKRNAYRDVQRIVKKPMGAHMQSCPPYLSDVLEKLCKEGKSILARNVLIQWSEQNATEFERLTGCEVLARAIHWDTDDPHTDLVFSRYDPQGGIILKHGLGSGGPWMTAADRLIRMGNTEARLLAEYEKALKAHHLRQSLTKKRKSDSPLTLPTDIQLARKVDDWVDRQLYNMGLDINGLKIDYIERVRMSKIDIIKQESEALKAKLNILGEELGEIELDTEVGCEPESDCEKNKKIDSSADPSGKTVPEFTPTV